MRKVVKFALPLLIVAAGVGAFAVLKSTRPQPEPLAVQERVWRVEVERAVARRLAPELVLYGRVETSDLLRAAASATAWVAEVAVRDGDRVTAGQVLVRLDERDFRPRIAQVEAQLAELQAEIESERNRHESDRRALAQERRLLALAEETVARQRRLMTQKLGAEQALDEAEQAEAMQALAVSKREMDLADHPSRLRALEARLADARARLDELLLELERATVRAPYEGLVTGVEVTEGDQVANGDVLVSLYALGRLEVRARIPAPYQGELGAAFAAGEPLAAVAEVGGAPLGLVLDRLAGEADPSGVDGLFRIAGDPARLRLGQQLTVRLARPAHPDAFAVPFRAVYGGGRLYRLRDGRLDGLDVEVLGARREADGRERLLVRSPQLATGDLMVTTHLPNAIDGLRVETVGEVADPPGGAADPVVGR